VDGVAEEAGPADADDAGAELADVRPVDADPGAAAPDAADPDVAVRDAVEDAPDPALGVQAPTSKTSENASDAIAAGRMMRRTVNAQVAINVDIDTAGRPLPRRPSSIPGIASTVSRWPRCNETMEPARTASSTRVTTAVVPGSV
jgi:hypothetical protein